MVGLNKKRDDVFQDALDKVSIDGLILEFGVYTGKSINKIARFFPDKYIFGFDSFSGLPEDWNDLYKKGHFSLDGKLPTVEKNVILIVGLFENTIKPFISITNKNIAFINFDADLYSSTKIILDACVSKIVPGTILYFDEFFFQDTIKNEYTAFKETNINANLISFGYSEEKNMRYSSFAFEVK